MPYIAMTGLGNTVIERTAADAHDDWSGQYCDGAGCG